MSRLARLLRGLLVGLLTGLLTGLLMAGVAPAGPAGADTATSLAGPQRWVRIEANLLVDRPADLMPTVDEARAAGATAVVLADPKTSTWMDFPRDARRLWLDRARTLRHRLTARGMDFVISTDPLGYCSPLLQHDVSLVAGTPVRRAPLVVRDGLLHAVRTARVRNGGFEAHHGDRPDDWGYQDLPGQASVIDTETSHGGAASLRFQPSTTPNARIFTGFRVRPHQQYVLSFWMRAESLTATYLGPYVASRDGRHRLTDQAYSRRGRPDSYFDSATALSTDWLEQRIALTTREHRRVRIALGAWGVASGRLWIDDVRLEAAPLLNVVRRRDLPVRLVDRRGRTVSEREAGTRLRDPELGRTAWRGTYDTFHPAPTPETSLADGTRVWFSGQAATVTTSGQTACSWNHPRLLALVARIHRANLRALRPDGLFLDVDEVRTGGFDPQDARYPTSGAALAAHVRRVVADVRRLSPRVPIYLWSDMFDPTQNAVARYYQVNGSLRRSWRGLPEDVIIVNWKAGGELRRRGRASVRHFAQLGLRQLVAGYYDEPVRANYRAWRRAVRGQRGIVGSMYTTWAEDFSRLPAFGERWW